MRKSYNITARLLSEYVGII